MKKYSAIFILLIFNACTLEEGVTDEAVGSVVIQGADPHIIVAPSYAKLRRMLGASTSPWVLSEHVSDEMMVPTRGENWNDGGIWRQLHTHTWNASSQFILMTWDNIENAISTTNTSLFLLSDYQQTPEIEGLMAEVRLLRALYRYWQFDLFGQITMRNEQDQNYNTPPPVLKSEEAQLWLTDEIIDILPQLNRLADEPNRGRASREAAHFLLSKIYLNAEVYSGTAQWQESLNHANEVINSGHFSLNEDYFSAFAVDNRTNNTEAILVASQGRGLTNDRIFRGPTLTLNYSQTFGLNVFFLNGFNAVESFVRKWDVDGDPSNGITTTDRRFYDDRIKSTTGTNLGFIIGPQFNPDGTPVVLNGQQLSYSITSALFDSDTAGARVLKYEPDLGATDNFLLFGTNDYLIFRFADVYLMRVEALFRLGDQSTALAELNTLRILRNMPALTSITAEAILDERGFELYWEGWRRQDLIRFGKFNEPWSEKPASENYKIRFPIPKTALAINPNLEQNEGY